MEKSHNLRKKGWLIPAALAALIPLSQLQSQGQQKPDAKPSTAGAVKSEAVSPSAADAAKTAPSKATSDENYEMVDGNADEFEEDHKLGTRILTGNVRIERENGHLYADKITQFWNPNDEDQVVIRSLAQGNVNMKEDDINATSDEAEFTDDNNIIDLRGSVVVLQGESRLEAAHFNYNRITGKRIGTGGVKFRVKIARKKPEETAPAAAVGSTAPLASDSERGSAIAPTTEN